MRIVLLVLILLLAAGCKQSYSYHHTVSREEQLASQIRFKVAYKLKEDKELQPVGIGSQMMDDIKMLALSFDYLKQVSIDEARELLIYATDLFTKEVNANDEIHPFLSDYPFTSKNIEIRIFLKSPDGRDVDPNELSVITMLEGELTYEIDDPESPLFKTLLTESYEEAVEKLKEAKLQNYTTIK